MMKVSVVIPAFNEEKLLPGTLASIRDALQAFEDGGWESEIIVCDNNSTDRTAEIARGEGVKVVFEPVNQISRARNSGAREASGDWFLFVDADCAPGRELFGDLRRTIEGGQCIGGGALIQLDESHFLSNRLVRLWNRISRRRRWAAGSFVYCERAAFGEVGGFSLELYASEEIDLSERLKALGRKQGREVVILQDHPLVTSARKFHLYSRWEILGFLLRTVLLLGRPLRSREACKPWYDGRR